MRIAIPSFCSNATHGPMMPVEFARQLALMRTTPAAQARIDDRRGIEVISILQAKARSSLARKPNASWTPPRDEASDSGLKTDASAAACPKRPSLSSPSVPTHLTPIDSQTLW